MKTIAILGAKGRLGHAAALAFHQAGFRVIAVSRAANASLPKLIEQRAADALNQAELITATSGAELILNALNPPYARWKSEVLPMGRNVIAAAKAHQARHVFIGNVYNYGTSIPARVTPNTPFQADTSLGKLRVELEAIFENAAKQQGVQTLILRAGDFYGAAHGSWFDQGILREIKKHKFSYSADWNLPHAWAYVPDLANAFVTLAQRSDHLPTFEQYLFEGHTLTGEQLFQLTEQALGENLKRTATPWFFIKLAGLVNRNMRLLGQMKYLFDRPHQLQDQRLKTWNLQTTPPEEAIRQALYDLDLLNNYKTHLN